MFRGDTDLVNENSPLRLHTSSSPNNYNNNNFNHVTSDSQLIADTSMDDSKKIITKIAVDFLILFCGEYNLFYVRFLQRVYIIFSL